MNFRLRYSLLAAAIVGLSLTACGKAKTTIIERDPLPKTGDDHDHGHAEAGNGRLVVISSSVAEALVFDLEDNSLIDSFVLPHSPSAVYASGGFRYAALIGRTSDHVGFLDGGLWREDHADHLHVYEEAPVLLSFSLTGSRPTHVVRHEGQLGVFYDGDAATSTPAAVHVVTDRDITTQNMALPQLTYTVNMHGAAEPRGEYLLATVRRSDADSTSANPILPDQVAVYHLHDGQYEQEEILDVICPDLHGAAQNEDFVAFGCSDGVLLIHDQSGEFIASKVANAAEVSGGLRVGTLYAHEHSAQFIGLASAQGGSLTQWVSVDAEEGEMTAIDWQPVEGARPLSHSFSFDGQRFLILDNQGYLTILEPHAHDGHTHWEYSSRVDITEEDIADMPEGLRFTMTVAQNGNYAYVADPIARHVLVVDLEDGDIVADIELDFAPASLVWLGIAEVHDE